MSLHAQRLAGCPLCSCAPPSLSRSPFFRRHRFSKTRSTLYGHSHKLNPFTGRAFTTIPHFLFCIPSLRWSIPPQPRDGYLVLTSSLHLAVNSAKGMVSLGLAVAAAPWPVGEFPRPRARTWCLAWHFPFWDYYSQPSYPLVFFHRVRSPASIGSRLRLHCQHQAQHHANTVVRID